MKHLKLIDVIQSAEFEKQVRICLCELYQTRARLSVQYSWYKLISVQYSQYKLKRTPLDTLEEKKMCNAKAITVLYANVLNKCLNSAEYSSTLRSFIKSIGDEALHRTVKQLKTKENEKDNAENI